MNVLRGVKNFFFSSSCKDANEIDRTDTSAAAGPSQAPNAGTRGARVKRIAVKREPLLLDPSEVSETIGVQGLGWYAERLKQDADGDVAMEFMELERPPEATQPNAVPNLHVGQPVAKEIIGLDEGRVLHN